VTEAEAHGRFPMPFARGALLQLENRSQHRIEMLHVVWPQTAWWGEGDWLIWTDENGWPPTRGALTRSGWSPILKP